MTGHDAAPGREKLAEPPDLLAAILERTSRSPCERTRQVLCDHVDRKLERTAAARVRQHLAGCPQCRSLAAALTALAEDLPAATLPWQDRLTGSWDQWLAGLKGVVERPRFTLEAAYVGAVLVALVVIGPGSPFRQLPAQALTVVEREVVAELSDVELAEVDLPDLELPAQVGNLQERVANFGHQAQARGARQLDSYRGWRNELSDRYHRIGEATHELGRHGAELGDAAVGFDREAATAALGRIGTDLGTIWQLIVSGQEPSPDSTESDLDEDPRRPT